MAVEQLSDDAVIRVHQALMAMRAIEAAIAMFAGGGAELAPEPAREALTVIWSRSAEVGEALYGMVRGGDPTIIDALDRLEESTLRPETPKPYS